MIFLPSNCIIIKKLKLNTTLSGLNDVHEENHFVWTKENFSGGYKKWCQNQPDIKNHRENN